MSNFKSIDLPQFYMKINETKLRFLSIEGSTTSTQQFQELRHAISNLVEDAEVEQSDPGLEKLKQMFLSSCMDEWMKV